MQTKYQRDTGLAPGFTGETKYALPNGRHAQYEISVHDHFGDLESYKNRAMGDVDTLIWSQTVINASNGTEAIWPDIEVHASECALYCCAKEYTFTVQNSTKKEVSSSMLNDPQSWETRYDFGVEELEEFIQSGWLSPDFTESLAFHPQDSLKFRTDLQLYINAADGPDQRWNISQEAVIGISYFMQTFFSACTNSTCPGTQKQWPAPTVYYILDQSSGHDFQPGPAKLLWEAQHLNKTFSNIAKSMSNVLRVDDENSTSQIGVITRSTTIYRINWA
ncbi:unnamed protein product [Clonostachys chloroleuca]|uniref:Uncharacterized protein n=1 Tax=Clonostachys chloroleuca TaxID=1926264 RepID=A0AA35QBC0_9HYPO|nr:unnamed protein product [Clonostachys chloroleuca]